MIYFTICSKNFLAYAQALCASLKAQHGPIRFYVALCDDMGSLEREGFPFELISLQDLGIPNLDEMQQRYSISELNTAIKPFVFLRLFDEHPGHIVVYLDPDIYAVSPFEELQTAIDRGATCVLTPHILQPAEFAEMNDQAFLQYGIYNLGFCALRDTPQTRRVTAWWGRRLERDCRLDLANGLFVDQKWADLLPAFLDETVILRHPGYNVAYWNLSQRKVRWDGRRWIVNAQPLRFFHFSGNKIEDPTVFSRHSKQFRVENLGDVARLLDEYRETVLAHGHTYYSTHAYSYNWTGVTGENLHAPAPVTGVAVTSGHQRPHLPLLRCRSLQEFETARAKMQLTIIARERAERDSIPFGQDVFTLSGYCACCGRPSQFRASAMYSPRTLDDGRAWPLWREHLDCLSCGLTSRMRASLHVFEQELRPRPIDAIYITEYVTPGFKWLKERYPNTRGSEFFPGDHAPGSLVNGVEHQDAQRLSFADESLDFILSFEVLEHVFDADRALREFYRCLRPGGALMFTAPFKWDSHDHLIRAEVQPSGEIVHHLEPEIHGNPLDMEAGSLCFRYFGWRVLDELRAMGFASAEALSYWSAELGYFGDPQFVLVARKAPEQTTRPNA